MKIGKYEVKSILKIVRTPTLPEEGTKIKIPKRIPLNIFVMYISTGLVIFACIYLLWQVLAGPGFAIVQDDLWIVYALIPTFSVVSDLKKEEPDGERFLNIDSIILIIIGCIFGGMLIITSINAGDWTGTFLNVGFEIFVSILAGIGISLSKE